MSRSGQSEFGRWSEAEEEYAAIGSFRGDVGGSAYVSFFPLSFPWLPPPSVPLR